MKFIENDVIYFFDPKTLLITELNVTFYRRMTTEHVIEGKGHMFEFRCSLNSFSVDGSISNFLVVASRGDGLSLSHTLWRISLGATEDVPQSGLRPDEVPPFKL